MAKDLPRRRRQQHGGSPDPTTVAAKAFDLLADALVVRTIGASVHYRRSITAPTEDDGLLVLSRTVAAADASPNTANPVAADLVRSEGGDVVVWHADYDTAAVTTAFNVEVWARTDLHVGGLAANAPIWVRVDTVTGVAALQEYRATIGGRHAFLRLVGGDAGQLAANPPTIRATWA